jgi:TolA-binding protein
LGRKYIRARKYIYLCLTSLIFFSFFGCATIEGMKKRRVARQGLLRGQELLTGGAYKESLRENQEVYYMVGESAPGDEAVFTMGLIYAHYKNPEKDYNKAISYFKKLIEDYPQSTLVEQARIWVGTLDVIAKEKLDAIAKEKLDAIEKKRQVAREKVAKKREVKGEEQRAHKHLIRSQKLLAKGDYQGALLENDKVLSLGDKNACRDKALFNAGLIYAHYENPEKDYNKAINLCFSKLIEDYPQSTLVEQAKLWVGTLEIIEKEKQVDIEIEEKKKELERQVVEREDVSPSSEPTTTVPRQGPTPADDERVNPDEPAPYSTVLVDEGGSLYFLALNHYKRANETLFEFILQANPRIKDVRQIDDHQEIIVPVITPESYVEKIPGGDYRVYIGTFTTEVIANGYAQRAESAGKHLSIDALEFSSQDTWYRLTMGDFKDKEDALKMVILLVKKGLIYIPPERDVMEQ